jgi:hypothetical protein
VERIWKTDRFYLNVSQQGCPTSSYQLTASPLEILIFKKVFNVNYEEINETLKETL